VLGSQSTRNPTRPAPCSSCTARESHSCPPSSWREAHDILYSSQQQKCGVHGKFSTLSYAYKAVRSLPGGGQSLVSIIWAWHQQGLRGTTQPHLGRPARAALILSFANHITLIFASMLHAAIRWTSQQRFEPLNSKKYLNSKASVEAIASATAISKGVAHVYLPPLWHRTTQRSFPFFLDRPHHHCQYPPCPLVIFCKLSRHHFFKPLTIQKSFKCTKKALPPLLLYFHLCFHSAG